MYFFICVLWSDYITSIESNAVLNEGRKMQSWNKHKVAVILKGAKSSSKFSEYFLESLRTMFTSCSWALTCDDSAWGEAWWYIQHIKFMSSGYSKNFLVKSPPEKCQSSTDIWLNFDWDMKKLKKKWSNCTKTFYYLTQ